MTNDVDIEEAKAVHTDQDQGDTNDSRDVILAQQSLVTIIFGGQLPED